MATSPGPVAASSPEPLTTRSGAPAPPASPGHWYLEWLSPDGRRALLRRLDGEARSALQTRVVEIDTGRVLAEGTFSELGKLPTVTIGRQPNEIAELMGRLAAPSLGEDLVRAAGLAEEFPFGSCGRLAAAPNGGAIAFNAGDWLYVADHRGRVDKRVTAQASYDPRFTSDAKFLLFRGATGKVDKVRAKYELFVSPSDLSVPPRLLPGTAGVRDRFAIDAEHGFAVAIASQEPLIKTCVLSIAMRPPFGVKKLACLEGGEQLVDSTLSPNGRYAAITTQRHAITKDGALAEPTWRLRVVSLGNGNVLLDGPAETGLLVRAISDTGILVQSGARGVLVDDVETKSRRALDRAIDIGHRGFFRSPTELVVVRGGGVAVVDLAKE